MLVNVGKISVQEEVDSYIKFYINSIIIIYCKYLFYQTIYIIISD
jgi:hypothetical protein